MIHEDIKAKHRAQADAMQHELELCRKPLGSIPDPREWAWHLPEKIVTTMTNPNLVLRKSYCATEAVAAALRPYGLCDYASRQLSVFGVAVLKELIGDEG